MTKAIMWGWGRHHNKDTTNTTTSENDDVNSPTSNNNSAAVSGTINNNSSGHHPTHNTAKSSPKSPLSISASTKKMNELKQRRRSWGGKDRKKSSTATNSTSTTTAGSSSTNKKNQTATPAAELLASAAASTAATSGGSTTTSTLIEKTSMHLAETYSGIEVSLSQENESNNRTTVNNKKMTSRTSNNSNNNPSSSSSNNKRNETSSAATSPGSNDRYERIAQFAFIESFQQQLVERQKVYRAQYQSSTSTGSSSSNRIIPAITSPSLPPPTSPSSPSSSFTFHHHHQQQQQQQQTFDKFQPRQHRLPLFTAEASTTNSSNTVPNNRIQTTSSLYDDTLQLLRNHTVTDEIQCVTNEINHLDNEIVEIEKDRKDIEQRANTVILTSSVAATTAPSSPSMISSVVDQSASIISNIARNITSVVGGMGIGTITATNNTEWDINRLLIRKYQLLPSNQIQQLQKERGASLTVAIENLKAYETLIMKCGGKVISTNTTPIPSSSSSSTAKKSTKITTIRPHNADYVMGTRVVSGEGGNNSAGGATNIQQISLMKCSTTAEISLFISRDTGPSYYFGRLPDRMFRRMKVSSSANHNSASNNNSNSNSNNSGGYTSRGAPGTASASIISSSAASVDHRSARDVIYLSTGPAGSYYAEYRNGECWWGLTTDDDELDTILKEWDIHQVVFGPSLSITTDDNNNHSGSYYYDHQLQQVVVLSPGGKTQHIVQHKSTTTSWIVLGRDGRVAWKNVPARLHTKLSVRLANESTPIDVSLGYGGSYFIRFLDGSTDWQLPYRAAEVCRRLEKEGVKITSISLHPELSHDFIIRHR